MQSACDSLNHLKLQSLSNNHEMADICDSQSSSSNSHPSENTEGFRCKLCPKIYKHKSSLKQHCSKIHQSYACASRPKPSKNISSVRKIVSRRWLLQLPSFEALKVYQLHAAASGDDFANLAKRAAIHRMREDLVSCVQQYQLLATKRCLLDASVTQLRKAQKQQTQERDKLLYADSELDLALAGHASKDIDELVISSPNSECFKKVFQYI